MKIASAAVTFCLGALVFASPSLWAQKAQKPKAISCSIQGFNAQQCAATATAMGHNISVYGQRQMYVAYLNLFRYQFSPQVNSTTIAAASVPGSLGPSPSSGAAATGNLAPLTTAAPSRPAAPPPPPSAGPCDSGTLAAGDANAQKAAVATCWAALQERLKDQITAVAGIRTKINKSIRSVADEQHCYVVRMRDFSQPILTQQQAAQLVQFATDNASGNQQNGTLACYKNDDQTWHSDDADTAWTTLVGIQTDLNNLQTAPGFAAWAGGTGDQAAYNSMGTFITNLIAEVASYATHISSGSGTNVNIGQAYTDFQNALDSNKAYRDSLQTISAAAKAITGNAENVLVMTIPLNPCAEWYGRGRTDTISLQYTDVSVTPTGSPASIPLGTNTCMPLSIASTGIGVSFLPNPVFAFVPGDNTGTQVIGETAVNEKSPLYAVLYNVKLYPIKQHSMEIFASPGVGFTSSSNTTTTDILGGLSLSLARRLLFITPSADIGQRNHLTPGFAIGTPKGSLTSVPTQSRWDVNFMISVSFGIGPS
jgi:hypothetical protein